MKYAKDWKVQVEELPNILRDACIDYKVWKKKIHIDRLLYKGLGTAIDIYDVMNIYIDNLIRMCKNIDVLFQKIYNVKILYIHVPVFRNLYKEVDLEILLQFAKINTKTLYKLTKKICKLYDVSTLRDWLNVCHKEHRYMFLGSELTKHIEMLLNNTDFFECPICFCERKLHDDITVPFLILPCGHNVCLECVLKQAQVYGKKGTWFNLLASADMRLCKCPICRLPHALQTIRHIKYLK